MSFKWVLPFLSKQRAQRRGGILLRPTYPRIYRALWRSQRCDGKRRTSWWLRKPDHLISSWPSRTNRLRPLKDAATEMGHRQKVGFQRLDNLYHQVYNQKHNVNVVKRKIGEVSNLKQTTFLSININSQCRLCISILLVFFIWSIIMLLK